MRRGLLCLLMLLLLGACSDDTKGPAADKGPGSDLGDLGVQPDAGPHDQGPASDKTAGDMAAAGDATACTTGGTECSGMTGLSCECCGSIGPMAICLCSKKCSADNDCQGSGLPLCNMAQGVDSGICTPVGFNCCWLCQ